MMQTCFHCCPPCPVIAGTPVGPHARLHHERTVDLATARENGRKLRILVRFANMLHASPGNQNILNFNLFGESAHLPDILHCETIAARSALHDWELAPHRHDRLHQLLLLAAGRGTVQIDGGPGAHQHVAGQRPARRRARICLSAGTEGWVTTLAAELLDEILSGVGDVRRTLAMRLW